MNPSTQAARVLVQALAAAGVRHVVLAPGSRSAPLAHALAQAALPDGERDPNALHPAGLEAHRAGLPLLLLTADRPHELRGTGANQTTDQVGIFGAAVRMVLDISAPVGGSREVEHR